MTCQEKIITIPNYVLLFFKTFLSISFKTNYYSYNDYICSKRISNVLILQKKNDPSLSHSFPVLTRQQFYYASTIREHKHRIGAGGSRGNVFLCQQSSPGSQTRIDASAFQGAEITKLEPRVESRRPRHR